MKWDKSHVGMIHYSDYWKRYSLILNVSDDGTVTCLDEFNIHGYRNHAIRSHATKIDKRDRLMTVAEFFSELSGPR